MLEEAATLDENARRWRADGEKADEETRGLLRRKQELREEVAQELRELQEEVAQELQRAQKARDRARVQREEAETAEQQMEWSKAIGVNMMTDEQMDIDIYIYI